MRELKSTQRVTDSLAPLFMLVDALGLMLVGYLIHVFYIKKYILAPTYLYIFSFVLLATLFTFPQFSLYDSWRGKNKWQRSLKILHAWSSILALVIFISFLLKTTTHISRVWLISWWGLGFTYLMGYRFIIDILLTKFRIEGKNRKKIVIFGAGQLGLEIARRLDLNYSIGYDLAAFIDDDESKKSVGKKSVVHSSELIDYIEKNQIRELWLALPLRSEKRMKEIMHLLSQHTIYVRFVPDIFSFRLLNHSFSEIAGIPVLDINGNPLSSFDRVVKRAEDLILGTLITLLISPLLILIALAIKLTSKGPILYKQVRGGVDNKPIRVYKFRSMRYDPEDKFIQARKGDSRITPIGKFLRKSSLDELPQFYNVLQGRMSIVGPRPHVGAMNEDYKEQIAAYMQRHKVKPGITGWAQVNGFRGETDTLDKMERRVEFDLYYIQNWSLLLDLKIIFLTVFKGFLGKNAY